MDGENGVKTIVYNTKKGFKERRTEKKDWRKERERESKRLKKHNSKKEEFFIMDHTNRSCPRILLVCMHV